MKVCLIGRSVNKCGGVSRYIAEIAQRISLKHEVHILCAWCEINSNIILHKYSIPRKPYFLQIFASFLKVSNLARKLDEKCHFDIIHAPECEGTYQDVITAHSCVRGAYEKLKRNNFVDVFRRLRPFVAFGLEVERMIYTRRRYKKIIAVSEGVKDELMNYYGLPSDDIVVIPNGVDLEEFKPDLGRREKIREKHGIEEDEVVLMFSGHEFKRKGLEYIIRALPFLKGGVKLFVVGRDKPNRYKELASKLGVLDRVIFTGFVTDIISEYYAASDIFVFPTAYEAFSLATLEAAASGLPLLATKVNGTEELIEDGYNGFFISRDPKHIAEKINVLVEDEGLRKQMSRNARRTAERYSWDLIAKKTIEVYEEVLKR